MALDCRWVKKNGHGLETFQVAAIRIFVPATNFRLSFIVMIVWGDA